MDDEATAETVVPGTRLSAQEVVGEALFGLERLRLWSTEEKLNISAQSVESSSSPALTRRLHEISSGQLYMWRKQFRRVELTAFVPISIAAELAALAAPELATEPPPSDPPPRPSVAEPVACGAVEVELPSGVKLRFTGNVEAHRAGFFDTVLIGSQGNVRVYLACGVTHIRKRRDTFAGQLQTLLNFDPHTGALCAFRGWRGDLIKSLSWDGQGLCLISSQHLAEGRSSGRRLGKPAACLRNAGYLARSTISAAPRHPPLTSDRFAAGLSLFSRKLVSSEGLL